MAERSIVSEMDELVTLSTAARAVTVAPAPSDEEVVAIMAGVEALWPRPIITDDGGPGRSTAWRFSGRWWARPISARRDRPFR